MRVLYPPGQSGAFADKAVEMTRDLASEHFTEERVTEFAKKQAIYAGREAMQSLPSLQEATGSWLRQYRKGRFEVTIDTSDLSRHVDVVRDIARLLVLALVTVGVLVASAIASTGPDSGPFRSLRHVAAVGYAVALALAVVLVLTVLWRARRERK